MSNVSEPVKMAFINTWSLYTDINNIQEKKWHQFSLYGGHLWDMLATLAVTKTV